MIFLAHWIRPSPTESVDFRRVCLECFRTALSLSHPRYARSAPLICPRCSQWKTAFSLVSAASLQGDLNAFLSCKDRQNYSTAKAIGPYKSGTLYNPVKRIFLALTVLLTAANAHAQSDPWSNAATKLSGIVSRPVLRGLAVVATMLAGHSITFAQGRDDPWSTNRMVCHFDYFFRESLVILAVLAILMIILAKEECKRESEIPFAQRSKRLRRCFRSLASKAMCLRMIGRHIRRLRSAQLLFALLLLAGSAYGQSDPWSNVATKVSQIFTGLFVRGFALVCVVVGGLEVAFGEGHNKRLIGGMLIGLAMALGAASFLSLFS
jgi:type IV secretory pathway VirB2 component (pilin)